MGNSSYPTLDPVKVRLPCCLLKGYPYRAEGSTPCHKPATRVVFFEMGDAATYCDDHGPNLNGPAHLIVLAQARLG